MARLFALALAVFLCVQIAVGNLNGTRPTAPDAWPNGPLKALYIDDNINWNNPGSTFQSLISCGYNLVIIAFFVSGKAEDVAQAWGSMSSADQQNTINFAHDKNARITVSAGGADDNPYKQFSGAAYGKAVADWAQKTKLDGVDFDLENFGGGFTAGGMNTANTIKWVADATNTARSILGANAIITHAPQFPYFGYNQGFGNGYGLAYAQAPSIDFLLIQYYNNGKSDTYQEIFVSLNGGSISEIAKSGIPLEKLVVGKPVLQNDGNDWISASAFHSIVEQASTNLKWNAGVMGWEWHDANTNSEWIKTIYP